MPAGDAGSHMCGAVDDGAQSECQALERSVGEGHDGAAGLAEIGSAWRACIWCVCVCVCIRVGRGERVGSVKVRIDYAQCKFRWLWQTWPAFGFGPL